MTLGDGKRGSSHGGSCSRIMCGRWDQPAVVGVMGIQRIGSLFGIEKGLGEGIVLDLQ